jgi:GTP cyclohydrolase I
MTQVGASRHTEVDLPAAADFLSALGLDLDREELRETPGRMVRAYAELLDAQPLRLTAFPNDEGYDELLPFSGVAHVGYLPGERILGLSKLARLVDHFAARPLEAEHSCMTLRGVRAHGSTTITSTLLGTLRADPAARAEFFTLAGVPS